MILTRKPQTMLTTVIMATMVTMKVIITVIITDIISDIIMAITVRTLNIINDYKSWPVTQISFHHFLVLEQSNFSLALLLNKEFFIVILRLGLCENIIPIIL